MIPLYIVSDARQTTTYRPERHILRVSHIRSMNSENCSLRAYGAPGCDERGVLALLAPRHQTCPASPLVPLPWGFSRGPPLQRARGARFRKNPPYRCRGIRMCHDGRQATSGPTVSCRCRSPDAMRGMGTDDTSELRQWAERWQRAGLRLRALRREELRRTETPQALMNLAGAFESCRLHHKPSATSGLVEQQAWFRRLAEKQRASD
jgi:hypothetical protein